MKFEFTPVRVFWILVFGAAGYDWLFLGSRLAPLIVGIGIGWYLRGRKKKHQGEIQI